LSWSLSGERKEGEPLPDLELVAKWGTQRGRTPARP